MKITSHLEIDISLIFFQHMNGQCFTFTLINYYNKIKQRLQNVNIYHNIYIIYIILGYHQKIKQINKWIQINSIPENGCYWPGSICLFQNFNLGFPLRLDKQKQFNFHKMKTKRLMLKLIIKPKLKHYSTKTKTRVLQKRDFTPKKTKKFRLSFLVLLNQN